MTGPTHIAIACTCGIMAGAGRLDLALLAGGAILPDLDHPQSFIGRVFFPISIPLSNWLGHRGAFHAIWLWVAVAALGAIIWHPMYVIGAGAITHVFADCATVSGVRAFAPWSEKLFVLFKREWRIRTGGRQEIVVLLIFGSIAWSSGYIGATGGIRAMLGHLTGSPAIMMEEYTLAGLQVCRVEGKIRWNCGDIEEGEWLIIGTESKTGLAIQGKEKIHHLPQEGYFQRARLKKQEKQWELLKIKGWAETETPVYFLDGKRWHHADKGDVVFGQVIGEKMAISSFQKKISLINKK